MNIPQPPSPAPLSSSNTYTTWPGGVDPTARLFNTDNQFMLPLGKGGARKSRKVSRRNRKHRKVSRRNRKVSRKNRKVSRKNRKASRRNRK